MLSKTKIALSAAMILSAAVPASAAIKHHRVARVSPTIYNAAPSGVSLSTACLPTDSPCRTKPDGW
jgi:hypothetical protein